jgi:hypothetical protein
MKKLSAIAVASFALAACGGSDNRAAPHAATTSQSAQATVKPHNGACPIINGRFAQMLNGEEETIYVNTAMNAGAYAYSFIDPRISQPQFQYADDTTKQSLGATNASDNFELTCNTTSVTYITRESGKEPIVIKYTPVGKHQLQVDVSGGGFILAGLYERVGR